MRIREYQKRPITRIENLNGKLVLGMCPNSGKTFVSILGIDAYLKEHPKEKWLIIAHSTNVIKDNFIQSLQQFKNDISFSWSTDLSDNSQVHIIITASAPLVTQKYNNVLVDEAHENYLTSKQSKDQLKNLIDKIGAKNELLLTGTPSKFVLAGGYDIEVVSLLEMPTQYMSTLGVELIETRYNWRSHYTKGGSLRDSAFGNMTDSEMAMSSITLEILNKIKNDLTAEQFNKVRLLKRLSRSSKELIGELFGNILKRTMFVCGSIQQADDVNLILNNAGVSSEVSHSESDESSELFNNFKAGKFSVLVVVNRGRLGYSDDGLYNIVDMSGTHNPDLIYQMFARVLRGKPNQQKYYYKVTTQEPGMRSLTHMSTCAALMLTDKEFLSTFNGKNFNGMKIPVIASSITKKSNGSTKKTTSTESNKLKLPEFTNDIIDFMRNIIADKDKEASVYKMTTIAEVKKILGESKKFQNHWTKENLISEAKKYDKPYELNNANRTAYQMLRDNRWIHEVWPNFIYRDQPEFYTYEKTIEILEKREFSRVKDFATKYNAAYLKYVKDDEQLKKKYFPKTKILKRWNDDEVIESLKKCKTRKEAYAKCKTAYMRAIKIPGLLDEIFGVEKGNRTKWTKDKVIEVAMTCSSRMDMDAKYAAAYAQLKKYKGLAEEIFGIELSKKPGRKNSKSWNEEKAMEALNKCKTRSEMNAKYRGAVTWFLKNNPALLDELRPKYQHI